MNDVQQFVPENTRVDMQVSRAENSKTRFCYVVPVTCLGKYRGRLPPWQHHCYVEYPQYSLETGGYVFRLARTQKALASTKPIKLTEQEATPIKQEIDCPGQDHEVKALPVSLLPYDLQELSTSISSPDLVASQDAEAEGAMSETWYISASDVADGNLQMVYVTSIPERLLGKQTGAIHTVWIRQEYVDQAMLFNRDLAGLDSQELRCRVSSHITSQGTVLPRIDFTENSVTAFTSQALEEQFHLVAVKDPITLRKEDVEAATSPEEILTFATAEVEQQRAELQDQMLWRHQAYQATTTQTLRHHLLLEQREAKHKLARLADLECLLAEAKLWWQSLRPNEQERILSISPVIEDVEVPVYTQTGKIKMHKDEPVTKVIQRHTGYALVVGVSAKMSLPWKFFQDDIRLPRENHKPVVDAPEAIVIGSRPAQYIAG